MILFTSLFLLGAIVAEALAWFSLSYFQAMNMQVLAFILCHAVASLLLCLFIPVFIPRYYRRRFRFVLWYVFLTSFFMPLLGGIGLLAAVLVGLRNPRKKQVSPWIENSIPDLPYRPLIISEQPTYGEGGLKRVLESVSDQDKRISVVMATRGLPDKTAIPILKIALKDSADDVRLLAYSMLNNKEKDLDFRIKEYLRLLKHADPERKSLLHQRTAQDYWELAYLGLVTPEALIYILEQVRLHARASLDDNSDNPGLHFLLGRTLMRQGRLEESESAFVQAQSLGLAQIDILPYLAEIAFKRGHFEGVKGHIRNMVDLSHGSPPIAQVAAYWS